MIDHPDRIGDNQLFAVLQSYTQHAARAIEQAVQADILPELNGSQDVSLNQSWDIDPYDGSIQVQCVSKSTGQIAGTYPSIHSASNILGVGKWNIQTYMNYDNYHYSPTLDDYVKFIDPQKPLFNSTYTQFADLPLYPGIDFETLRQ